MYVYINHFQKKKCIYLALVDGTCWLTGKVQSNASQKVDILKLQIDSNAESSKPVHYLNKLKLSNES